MHNFSEYKKNRFTFSLFRYNLRFKYINKTNITFMLNKCN